MTGTRQRAEAEAEAQSTKGTEKLVEIINLAQVRVERGSPRRCPEIKSKYLASLFYFLLSFSFKPHNKNEIYIDLNYDFELAIIIEQAIIN